MKKGKNKKFEPIIFDNFEAAYKYETDILSVFPLIKDKKVTGYRIWLEEDKNYLRNIISEELYLEGYSSEDFDLIKERYNWPYHIVEEICYGINLIENYIEEISL